ncbi:MAG: hypothetical protein SGBAC_005282 [Bacillariaceae sp.]
MVNLHVRHYNEVLHQEDESEVQNDAVDDKTLPSTSIEEPSCQLADNLTFATTCFTMEIIWKTTAGQLAARTLQQKLDSLLSTEMLHIAKQNSESLFPLLRLYCPDKDSTPTREYGINEQNIAQAYCDVLGLQTRGGIAGLIHCSDLANMLLHFRDPTWVRIDLVGDLSMVVQHVMNERTIYTQSKLDLGDINALLDELAALNPKQQHYHHDACKTEKENVRPKVNAKANLRKMLEAWFRKVILEHNLSPLEHKWLVRIILKKPDLGVRSTSILRAYSPYANGLLAADGNLKHMCDKLAGPYFE